MGGSSSSWGRWSRVCGAPAGDATGVSCRLRIVSINDVYELDNLPRLKTFLAAKRKGWPAENFLAVLPGDFLAPSLLSSLDAGLGMVKVLNALPVDMVCFGNHESDIPQAKLVHRIQEFNGTWLNSNMPDFVPQLPRYELRRLRGEAGPRGTRGGRQVAFLGLCLGGGRHKNIYRNGSFGGAAEKMVPVLEAAEKLHAEVRSQHREVSEVIPLTHQDLADDVKLAEMGLFPAIIGGHDHEALNQRHGGRSCPIVKAGMNATHAAVVDIVWPLDAHEPPTVAAALEELSAYEPDAELMAKIERIKRPMYELETAVIYEIEEGEELSSVGVRAGETSMARLVATALRDVLRCDAAILNAGAVRGNKRYTGGLSYGDLKRECPFPSPILSIRIPCSTLSDAVRDSRRPWWDVPEGGTPGETPSALQVDYGIATDSQHRIVEIREKAPEEERLYIVACDSRVLKRSNILRDYCERFPEHIPPEDAGRPVVPLLVEFFCGQLWRRLITDAASGPLPRESRYRGRAVDDAFQILDVDNNGLVSICEMTEAVSRRLGERLSSRIVVEQMVAMLDSDNDGCISCDELRHGISRFVSGDIPIMMSL